MEGLTPHKGTPAEVLMGEELVVRAFAILAILDLLHIEAVLLLVQHKRTNLLCVPVINNALVVVGCESVLEATHEGEPVFV